MHVLQVVMVILNFIHIAVKRLTERHRPSRTPEMTHILLEQQ
jgi:hypothetical protein